MNDFDPNAWTQKPTSAGLSLTQIKPEDTKLDIVMR
jgi:hypothetical protein